MDRNALKLIHSYLSDRKHRTKINNSFSHWAEIKSGVPQGSILGPLLFNIYMNDIFLFLPQTKIANYADDNTPCEIENSIRDVISKLEYDMKLLTTWFENNYMASNDDKCKLIITNEENSFANIEKEKITCSQSVKLLGVMIDKKLNFKDHVSKICKKASQKIHALARISNYMSKDKLKTVMKAFI